MKGDGDLPVEGLGVDAVGGEDGAGGAACAGGGIIGVERDAFLLLKLTGVQRFRQVRGGIGVGVIVELPILLKKLSNSFPLKVAFTD
jgi:hypothetical protein